MQLLHELICSLGCPLHAALADQAAHVRELRIRKSLLQLCVICSTVRLLSVQRLTYVYIYGKFTSLLSCSQRPYQRLRQESIKTPHEGQ